MAISTGIAMDYRGGGMDGVGDEGKRGDEEGK